MTTEEWLAEQRRAWGEVGTHDVFADTVERLKAADARLTQLAEMTGPEDADVLVAGIIDAMAPPDSFGTGPAHTRFTALRPAVTERVAKVLDERRGGDVAVWIVANTFLRGDTRAVEENLPPVLRGVGGRTGGDMIDAGTNLVRFAFLSRAMGGSLNVQFGSPDNNQIGGRYLSNCEASGLKAGDVLDVHAQAAVNEEEYVTLKETHPGLESGVKVRVVYSAEAVAMLALAGVVPNDFGTLVQGDAKELRIIANHVQASLPRPSQ